MRNARRFFTTAEKAVNSTRDTLGAIHEPVPTTAQKTVNSTHPDSTVVLTLFSPPLQQR